MLIENIPFSLIDVGASGGVQKKWSKYKNLNFYGFEPDDRDKATQKKIENQTWFNIGVYGEPGVYNFNLLKEQCNSSLLEPNLNLIRTLAYDANDFSLTKQIKVQCDNLDNICRDNKINPDVIKLDTQGTEFEILKHSLNVLDKSVLCAEIEVEFLELYKEQKLFADVDQLMRQNGYTLFDIGNQLYMKGQASQNFNLRKGYLVAADALYFKSLDKIIENLESYSPAKLLALIPICQAYGYLNYAYEVFQKIKNINSEYYNRLVTEFGDPLDLIKKNIPRSRHLTLSERKYSKVKDFFEKRIKPKNANWNYGLGNPVD